MRAFPRTLLAAVLVAASFSIPSSFAATGDECTQRLLVLSAFPGEIAKTLGEAHVHSTEEVDGHRFYVGHLRDNDVVMALSGIGLVNAEATTRAALAHFRCNDQTSINGVVFSGVAGGPHIGDVTVPTTWTLDGQTRFAVDPAMLGVATDVADDVQLARETPVGDPACVGTNPNIAATVTVDQPHVLVGGAGESSDGFGGRAFPCFPGGGDVFGCAPCSEHPVPDVARFASDAAPFIDPNFFFGYFQATPPAGDYVAGDMETAAVAKVTAEAGIPFIAFRAASDGAGDPLNLPGFPFQFFFYRQLAADNAAAVALAFLDAWADR